MTGIDTDNALADLLTEMEEGCLREVTPELQEISDEIQMLSDSLRGASPSVPFGEEPQLSSILDQAMQLTRSPALESTVVDMHQQNEVPVNHPRRLGHYELLEELGAGGMGTIYRAQHQKLNRTVALKLLPSDRFQSTEMVERFEREMRAVGMLQHPNIVAAHDAGEVDGCHYLVMELIEGLDLGKLIARLGPITVADACEISRQVAMGLQHISDHGLVHRDIKPSNLILARSMKDLGEATVKILDLGLALLDSSQSGSAREITATGQVMGTIDYMAPEQGLGTHLVDIRADLYSLGATLYKLLIGRAPLQDPRHTTTLQRIRALEQETPPPVIALRPDCPAELSALIDRLLSKSPLDRPERPDVIVSTLARFTTGANLADLLTRAMQADSPVTQIIADTTVSPSRTAVSVPLNAQPERKAGRERRSDGPRGPWRPWAAAAGGALVLLLAAIVLFFDSPYGVVRVESNDPEIKIAFENDELKVVGAYAEPVTLKPGPQGLRVQHGDFEFKTKQLKVSRGDKVTLRIEVLPGKIEVVHVGKGVLDSHQLPPVERTPSHGPSTKAVAADLTKPFTLKQGQSRVRNFSTLAGAVAEASGNDTIEVHGRGPYAVVLERIVDKNLRLQAASGSRPRLYCRTPVDVRGNISFEGLDLDFRKGQLTGSGDQVQFDNCRVIANGLSFGGSAFTAKNSVLMLTIGLAHFGQKPHEFRLDNCLVQCQMSVLAPDDAETVHIHLKHNTIYQEVFDGGGLILASEKPQVHVHAEGNIFHYRGQRQFLDIPDWQKQMGKSLHWSGKNNLYSGTLFWAAGANDSFHPATIDDWNKLLDKDEPGSRFVPQVDLQFVRLMEANINELRPHAERILRDARERNDLPDLGPNLELVGPGEGYLRWLEQEHRAPQELRPEVEVGGSFVLLSPTKPPVGFRTLQEAAQAAVNGDTIELRQDNACGSLELQQESGRTLTLRGAVGYHPVINSLRNLGNDCLILENITFDAPLEGGPWDPEKKVFRGTGGVHRVGHCQFIGTGSLMAPFVPMGNSMPSIHHCRLTGLHFGVETNVRLELSESVLAFFHSARDQGQNGTMELKHCLFWNPEPRFAFRPLSFGVATTLINHESVLMEDTYLSAAGALCRLTPPVNSSSIDHWQGQRNLHALPNYIWAGSVILCLDDWKTVVKSEAGSCEDLPLLAEPRLWNLIPSQPDSHVLPDGLPVGAEISRITLTSISIPEK